MRHVTHTEWNTSNGGLPASKSDFDRRMGALGGRLGIVTCVKCETCAVRLAACRLLPPQASNPRLPQIPFPLKTRQQWAAPSFDAGVGPRTAGTGRPEKKDSLHCFTTRPGLPLPVEPAGLRQTLRRAGKPHKGRAATVARSCRADSGPTLAAPGWARAFGGFPSEIRKVSRKTVARSYAKLFRFGLDRCS